MATIDHVVVLMLENRSFDHMLGFLDHPDPAFDGLLRGGPYVNPGWERGAKARPEPRAKRVLPVGPDHSHEAVMEQLALTGRGTARRPTMQGFVKSYERKGRGLAAPRFGGVLGPVLNRAARKQGGSAPVAGRGDLVMLCQPPDHVPVLSTLALQFAVCTRWFCSVPGETWPNRNFAHAATSDGETEIQIRAYYDKTIFELLEDNGSTWRVYHDDVPQVWAFQHLWDTAERHRNWHPYADFADHARAGTLPAYSFIEPNHRPPVHTPDREPLIGRPGLSTSQHPDNNKVPIDQYDDFPDSKETDFVRAESLIAATYEALRSNPEAFARTLLLITYDEHGGLYDHVPPPTNVPPPGDRPDPGRSLMRLLYHRITEAFDFRMLGARVPAVVVSPLIPAGKVDATVRDHASIPSTLRALFAPKAGPLTARDAWAPPFHGVVTLPEPRTDLPDLSAYVRPAMAAERQARAEAMQERAADDEALAVAEVPSFYHDFVKQADQVRDRLVAVGEPEIVESGPPADNDLQRSAQTSEAFAVAAVRHRDGAAPRPG